MPAEESPQAYGEKVVITRLAGSIGGRRATLCDDPGRFLILSPAEATAYHEAAHSVAAVVLGWGAYELSIIPEPDIRVGHKSILGGYASVGRAYTPIDREKYRREGLKNDIKVAAMYSELLTVALTGRTDWRSILRTVRLLRARAREIIFEHWYLVRYLARELAVRGRMEQSEIAKALAEAQAVEMLRRRALHHQS
jgi:hypothetical protein